jgi:hypothetical protein
VTSEQSIHERVWAVYQAYKAPGAILYHIPNGEKRGPRVAAKLKRMGVVAGVPDFQCIARGRVSFLELKRARGRVSTVQSEFCGEAYANGVTTFVARSAQEAVECLQSLGVLRADVHFSYRDPGDCGEQDRSEAKVSGLSTTVTERARAAA